ncbi:anti-sigma factor [Pseudoroseicyclus sp. H15]
MSDVSGTYGDDPRLTAAEYALGLLTSAQARAFEQDMAGDPALAAEAMAWGERLAQMAEAEVDPVSPPAHLRRRIETRLFGSGRRRAWFGLGGVVAAAIVALAIVFGPQLMPGQGPVDQEYVATVASDDQTLVATAAYHADLGALRVLLQSGEAPSGRVLELWAIVGDEAPVSLGLIDAPEQMLALSPELAASLPTGLLLAITDEPPGGAPNGEPTGSVLAAGPLTAA